MFVLNLWHCASEESEEEEEAADEEEAVVEEAKVEEAEVEEKVTKPWDPRTFHSLHMRDVPNWAFLNLLLLRLPLPRRSQSQMMRWRLLLRRACSTQPLRPGTWWKYIS